MKRFGLLLLGIGAAFALSLASFSADLSFTAAAESLKDVVLELPPVRRITDENSFFLPKDVLEMNSIVGDTDEEYAALIAEWREVNEDVVGYIDIPDFEISYPVLQGENNKTYLRTDIYGEKDVAGCIFLDSNYRDIYSPVKLIHGHHMANKTMFGKIPDLLFYETLDDAPTVYYTDDLGTKEFRPFAVFSVNSEEESVIVGQDLLVKDLEELKDSYIERSWVEVSEVPESIELLMLNTCWYGFSGNEHFLHCIVVCARV